MADVKYSGIIKTAGFKTSGPSATNDAIEKIRATLIDAGWTEGDPLKAHTPGFPFPFGAPWWDGTTGNAVNGSTGWVLGLFQYAVTVDGADFYFYNGAAGQPLPPGVAVQIGSSADGTLGELAGQITTHSGYVATFDGGYISLEAKPELAGTLGNTLDENRISGSAGWVGPVQQPYGGGYMLTSQTPNNNAPFSIKVYTNSSSGLVYEFPDLATIDAGTVDMAGSDVTAFWANPYGFAMYEPGDIGSVFSPRNIWAFAPWLPDGAAAPLLLRMTGTTRNFLDTPQNGLTSFRAMFAGSTYENPKFAWYAPRAQKNGQALTTTAGKALLFDSWIGVAIAGGASAKRILGWIYDSVLTTEAVGLDGQAEMGGLNWFAWRSNLGSLGGWGGGVPVAATVWLLTE